MSSLIKEGKWYFGSEQKRLCGVKTSLIINMQSIVSVLAALVGVISAQTYVLPGYENLCRNDPRQCLPNSWLSLNRMGQRPGDITWKKPAGGGNVFGTIGSTDQGLFGQAGYNKVIFDDARGKLEAQAHGTRVLGPAGDSSQFGGTLEFANKNANAALDISKQIGGDTSVSASGAGKWHPDKNTEVSAGGSVSHSGHGRPDIAVQATVEHKF